MSLRIDKGVEFLLDLLVLNDRDADRAHPVVQSVWRLHIEYRKL